MNTKGVEDGMPQSEKFVCTDPECFGDCHPIRKPSAAESPEELLAAQIVKIAVILGITKGDMSLTGPQVLLLAADIKELLRLRAVPVEERTQVLMEALTAVENERLECHNEAIKREEYSDEWWRSDDVYSRAIHDAEESIKALISTPIPEERTAEMELGPAIIEAIGALRSSYNVQDFPGDGDTRQDHAANALERIWDHIEGKG